MRKFFCFYCQKYVEPRGFKLFRICPNCRRRITDNGEGFYKVCDVCGANLPANAKKCLCCGYHFNKGSAIENFEFSAFLERHIWLSWILLVLALVIGIVLMLGVIYVSFYVAAAILLFAGIALIFNIFRAGLRL